MGEDQVVSHFGEGFNLKKKKKKKNKRRKGMETICVWKAIILYG